MIEFLIHPSKISLISNAPNPNSPPPFQTLNDSIPRFHLTTWKWGKFCAPNKGIKVLPIYSNLLRLFQHTFGTHPETFPISGVCCNIFQSDWVNTPPISPKSGKHTPNIFQSGNAWGVRYRGCVAIFLETWILKDFWNTHEI